MLFNRFKIVIILCCLIFDNIALKWHTNRDYFYEFVSLKDKCNIILHDFNLLLSILDGVFGIKHKDSLHNNVKISSLFNGIYND